jgi:hypothetical protein
VARDKPQRRNQRHSRWRTRHKARRHNVLQNFCNGERLVQVKDS